MLTGALGKPVVLAGLGSFLAIGLWYIVPIIALLSSAVGGVPNNPTPWAIVFEDELGEQFQLVRKLERAGFLSKGFATCTGGIEFIKTNNIKPMVATMDGQLADGWGHECIIPLLTISPTTFVIFRSGNSALEVDGKTIGAQAIENGARQVFEKSVSLDELIRIASAFK